MFRNFRLLVPFVLLSLLSACSKNPPANSETPPGTSFPDPDSLSAPVPVRQKKVNATLTGTLLWVDDSPAMNGAYWFNRYSEYGQAPANFLDGNGFFRVSSDQMKEDATVVNLESTIPVSAPVILQEGHTHYVRKKVMNSRHFSQQRTYPGLGISFNDAQQPNFAMSFPAGTWLNNKQPYTGDMYLDMFTFILDNRNDELELIQPGDLRGISKSGEMVMLSPYLAGGLFPGGFLAGSINAWFEMAAGKQVEVKVAILPM